MYCSMVGLRITEFITQLRACGVLKGFDQVFLKSFDDLLLTINLVDTLTPIQLETVQQLFTDRWNVIADKSDDYTFTRSSSNKCWIKLAHDLAIDLGLSSLQILMPTITNTYDPNNFEKHADCRDLRNYYISDNGKILYSIDGLLKISLEKSIFFSYVMNNDGKKYTPSPLSIRELWRFRSKKGDLRFEVLGECYDNFWDYLTRKVISGWHECGEVPKHLLPLLLELVDIHFTEKKMVGTESEFSKKLVLLSKYMQESRIDDVNCLYGQEIEVEGKAFYLIDVLLDFMDNEFDDLDSKMLGLARWLCVYDASLVSCSSKLEGLYEELDVGPAFRLSDLQFFLTTLPVNSFAGKVQRSIDLLSEQLPDKTKIDSDVIASLGEIYRLRWLQILGKRDDYTWTQETNTNIRWIRLAQLLSGAGYISKNYYNFLMPTLVHDTDPVGVVSLSDYPLSHYVLARDARSLIYLGNCEQHYKIYGTFCNCNTMPPTPLTEIELKRLHYASSRFRKFIELAHTDLPLARDTVFAVYDLVKGSLYSNGLFFARSYTKEQDAAAQAAYHVFYNFLNKLSKDEKERLYAQRIVFEEKNMSFKRVLDEVAEDECIALSGQYFLKMVMDYAPYLRFTSELENESVTQIKEMRAKSQNKVFSEYNAIDDQEAKRRIQILAASILTHVYPYSVISEQWFLLGCSNTKANVAKDIYLLIAPLIMSDNYKHARYVYASIIETVIKPALSDRGRYSMTWFMRPSSIQSWIDSIADNTLFTKKNAWFEPSVLLSILQSSSCLSATTYRFLEPFLQELLQTYAQPECTALKEIIVNIKFAQVLNSLDITSQGELLKQLTISSKQVDDRGFYDIYASFLIQRLASIGATAVAGRYEAGFFVKAAGCDKAMMQRIEAIKILLNESVSSSDPSMPRLCEKLSSRVSVVTTLLCDDLGRLRMKEYLDKILHPMASLVPMDSLSVTV
jgi:hypothetical protein